MQIEDFDYLLAVAEGGSISRGAELLGISQPALTKAMRRIEADVGLRLFERTAKGVVATEAGRSFIQRATRISLEYSDAMQEMHQIRTGEQGVLRLGFSRTVNEQMVFAVCKLLLRERPVARFELRERLTGELMPMLRAGDLDLALAPLPHGETIDMQFIPLYSDHLYFVAALDHPLRRRKSLGMRDLADAEWMLPPRDTRVRLHIDEMFRARGMALPRIRIETDFGSGATFSLVQGTQLLTICGDSSKNLLQALGLGTLDVAGASFGRDIGIMYRPEGYLSPLAQRVIELFRQAGAGATPG